MDRIKLIASGVLMALASSIIAASQSPAPPVTVFLGARLIDGDGNPFIEDSAFIVEGTRFGQVGRRGQLKIPPGAVRVSLIGKTVMPAVIDTHTHLAGTREALVEQLQRKAYYGAAAVVSLGRDAGDLAFQVRNEIIPNAARLLTAGRGITAPEPGRSDLPYWVTTEADARKAVQELAARKVDLVKIWVDDRGGKYKKLTPGLYRAIIDEAHARGLRVIAHIYALQDAKDLLRAGVDAFAHGVQDQSIDQELVTLFKERRHVFYVPNLPDQGVATDLSWLGDIVPPDELKKLQAAATDRPEARAAFAIQHANMVWLHYEGVRLALGTDSSQGWSHHLEMADMAAAGRKGALIPVDVIAAATRNSAELLGLKDHGAIKPGNVANFVVLNGNAGLEIMEMRKIAAVYLRGTEVDRAAAPGALARRFPVEWRPPGAF
jgi:imidazolonepropionase-like amidohydrolase